MAFTKTENRVARTGPDDVRISFHVADAGSQDAGARYGRVVRLADTR